MSEKKGKRRILERGQGLVEYALILILAAIVVIVVLGLFGERIRNFYCEIVLSVAPDVDAPACNQLGVTCNLNSVFGHYVNMEAVVNDNQGPKDIVSVKWYDNGNPVRTEWNYRYCLGAGDSSCGSQYISTSGEHTISAVALDAEGHTGSCSRKVVVP
jgi:pilus assembly protein Flp/PilA